MRILVISELFPPHYVGGAELSCREHVEGLRGRGHEVSVLTSSWGLPRAASTAAVHRVLRADPLNLAPCRDGRARRVTGLARWPARVARPLVLARNRTLARRVLARVRPQVAYVWNMRYVSVRPILAAQALGIPIVYRVEDYWLADLRRGLKSGWHGPRRWYRAVAAGLSAWGRLDVRHMVMNSEALRQSYLTAGFGLDSMTVIPTGLPADWLSPPPEPAVAPTDRIGGGPALAFVGRLSPEKGPEVALRVLALLARQPVGRGATLDVIGSGSAAYLEELTALAGSLGIGARVRFAGMVDHAAMIARYPRYDALLFPSRWAEPFGRSVVEAMARGVPVVATGHGGPAEIIAHGETGLLVPPGNVEVVAGAMAAALDRLLSQPALWQRVRAAALERVRRDYALEGTIARVEAYLAGVVGRAEVGRPRRDAACAF